MRTTIALFVFWWVVVTPVSLVDVAVGLGAALLLAAWAARYLWPRADHAPSSLRLARVPAYVAMTAWRVVTSAARVLRIVFARSMPIEPTVLTVTVRFDEDAARVTYANSITITPGTLTLDVRGDTFVVHALHPALAGDVLDGTLARDVARLFERRAS